MKARKKTAKRPGPGRGRYRKGSTTLSAAQRAIFLNELIQGWSPTYAAIAAKGPRSCFYNLRERDQAFARQWDAAVDQGTDYLEDVAKRRAVEGWDEPLSYKGELTGATVKKFDHTLLMMQLNGRRPEKYRQNVKVDAPDLAASFSAAMAATASRYPIAGKANGHDQPKA